MGTRAVQPTRRHLHSLCIVIAIALSFVQAEADSKVSLRGSLEGCGSGESLLFVKVTKFKFLDQTSEPDPCILTVYDSCGGDGEKKKVILKTETEKEELEMCISETHQSELEIKCTNDGVFGSYEIRTAKYQVVEQFEASNWDQARGDYSQWNQVAKRWDIGSGCPPKQFKIPRKAPTINGICFEKNDCNYNSILEPESDAFSCVNTPGAESFMVGGFGGRCEDIVTCYDTCSDCSCVGVNALAGDCMTEGGSFSDGRDGQGSCSEIADM
jgi:hypothetical protein